jgi:hypothetical protein
MRVSETDFRARSLLVGAGGKCDDRGVRFSRGGGPWPGQHPPSPLRPSARRILVGLLVAAVAATTAPNPAVARGPDKAQRRFTVVTQNLYLGANLVSLFGKAERS